MRLHARNRTKFERAGMLLGHGYPQAYVAAVLEVAPNTLTAWARKLGFAVQLRDRHASRRVRTAVRRFLRLGGEERRAFFEVLAKRSLLPKEMHR